MQHGRPLTLDAQRLVVGFAKQDKYFLESLLEPENLMVIRDAAQALLGRSFHIALETVDGGVAETNGLPGTGAIAEQDSGALEEAQRQKNELKQAVIDIFGATPI
jgi:hypothetical protein